MFTKLIAQQAHLLAEEVGLDSNQEQVVQYSITILTTTVFGYLAIAIGGLLTGALLPALIAACSASLLRVFSGGAHASTPVRCVLIGAVIFASLGWLSRVIPANWFPFLLGVIVLSAIIFLGLFAPADTPGKPIASKMQRKWLKLLSYSIFFGWSGLIWSLLGSGNFSTELIAASMLGMFWQTFSITPLGYWAIHLLESLLELLTGKGRTVKP